MEATFPCAGSHAHPGAAKQTPRDTAPRRHHPAARTVSRRWSRSAWRLSVAAVPVAYGPQRLSGHAGHRVQEIPAHTLAGEITVTACSLVPSPLGRDAAGAIDQAVPLQRSSSARNGAQQFGCACRANPAAQACPPPGRAPSGAGVRRGPQRPHPNPSVAAASSTVRSISRRSRSRSISQARNQTKVPSETAAPPRPSSPAPAASAGRRTSRAGSRLSERQRARPGGNACPAYSLAALPAMVRVLAGAWVISIRRACAAGAAGMVTRRTPSA